MNNALVNSAYVHIKLLGSYTFYMDMCIHIMTMFLFLFQFL